VEQQEKMNFKRYLNLLIRAVWGDKKAANQIGQLFVDCELDQDQDIWQEFESRKDEVVLSKLAEIVQIHQKTQKALIKDNEVSRRNCSERSQKLHNKEPIDLRIGPEKETVVRQLGTRALKDAYSLGCTFNSSDFVPIYQYMYACKDCERETFEDVAICDSCALFCHAGHNLEAIANGSRIKTTCDCGGGILDGISCMNS